MSSDFQSVLDAIERTGRIFRVRNGECNTRCPVCGDSRKSSQSMHLYINLEPPHRVFCQRCNYSSGYLTSDLLEAMNIAESDARVYARTVMKEMRLSGKGRRGRQSLDVGGERLVIPPPNRDDPDDAAAVGYIERRLGGPPFEEREIQRYKMVCCGLYGFLEANGIDRLNVPDREGDRLNETCVGFLSADESYVIFRTMDDDFVKAGGRRYTNYRIYSDWEGSKSFACRSDVSLLEPRYTVVCSEGIIDLIQIERQFYGESRWGPAHVGVATCGTAHATVMRQMVTVGILSMDAHLYIDYEPGLLERAQKLPESSPFFGHGEFSLRIFRNGFSDKGPDGALRREKDFGVHPDRIRRVEIR